MATLVVSLGSNCYVSWTLRRIGLQAESLPLDWVNSFRFGPMLDFLEHFTEGDILDMQRSSLPVDKDAANVYEIPKYGFRLPHEHDVHKDNTREEIAARYRRRMDRLKEMCRTADHVVFVRTVSIRNYSLPVETADDYAPETLQRASAVLHNFCGGGHFTLAICDERSEVIGKIQIDIPRITKTVLGVPFENGFFDRRPALPQGKDATAIFKSALGPISDTTNRVEIAQAIKRLSATKPHLVTQR